MLDLGFLPDIERLVDRVPAKRQTMLFSATMPGEIVALSRRYLTRPTNVRAESHEESEATPQVVQHVFQAHQMDKPELLSRVLQARGRGLTMVFCQTKRACDRVAEDLVKRGFAAAAVHGDLGQGQRERALRAFRAGKIDVLVATDVAARGLDVDDVTHVVNYECPDAADTYVHRIGRTGRAGKEGIAVTLVDWSDLQRWKLINSALDLGIAEPAETYSTSDHLYEALDIPTDITGTLPRAQRERAGLEAEEVEDIGETGRTRSPRHQAEPRARKPRQRTRTRTRSGQPLDADAPVTAPEEAAPAEETRPPRTRRRTRRTAETSTEVRPDTTDGDTPDVTVSEEATSPPRTRRRTRRTADASTEARPDTTDGDTPDVVVPDEDTSPPRTRRRTRQAAEASTDTQQDTIETAVNDDTVAETPAAPAPVQAPTASTAAGVPVVQFMAPPADPAAEAAHLPEPAQSQPRRRRRPRSTGARRPV
jgi:superfamily II DNA/RNA helicase